MSWFQPSLIPDWTNILAGQILCISPYSAIILPSCDCYFLINVIRYQEKRLKEEGLILACSLKRDTLHHGKEGVVSAA